MLISFKFNYISYQVKNIVWINKIYLYLRTNLIIYVIVTNFLIIQYIYIYIYIYILFYNI